MGGERCEFDIDVWNCCSAGLDVPSQSIEVGQLARVERDLDRVSERGLSDAVMRARKHPHDPAGLLFGPLASNASNARA